MLRPLLDAVELVVELLAVLRTQAMYCTPQNLGSDAETAINNDGDTVIYSQTLSIGMLERSWNHGKSRSS